MKIAVTTNNNIGRVVLGQRSTRVRMGTGGGGGVFTGNININGANSLSQLNDVVTANQADGDVLVYQQNSNNYIIKTLPKADGGSF